MRRFGRGFELLALALLAASGLPGIAQAVGQESKGAISSVAVLVDGVEAGPDIEGLILISAGEPYSLKKIDAAVKQLYGAGLFSDVRVLGEGTSEVKLTFLLSSKLRTRKITISGEGAISAGKLKESLNSLRSDSEYTEERLRRAVGELEGALRKEGYFKPSVRALPKKDPDRPVVDVEFEVAPGRRYTIKSLDLVGVDPSRIPDLERNMKSRIGLPYVPSILSDDISRINEYYKGLGYPRADVNLAREEFDSEKETVALSLRIIPNEKITISILGARVPVTLVSPIWEEPIFEDWGVAQSETLILNYLRGQGYVFASVKSSVEKAAAELRIVHEVRLGQKYGVYDVDFEGLRLIKPADLRRDLGISPSLPLLGGINGDRIFEMPGQIKRLYEIRGFSETRVDLNFKNVGGEMRAVFYIDEGPQRTIGDISIAGASLFGPDVLRAQIPNAKGGPFYQPDIQRDVERLTTFYLNQGVRGTSVTAAIGQTAENVYSVRFNVSEGQRVKIQRIIVTGNKSTRQSTIDRELMIRQGDWASSDRILETTRRLERLGIFSEVRTEEIPVSPGAENLVISLREGERYYLGLGIGMETASAPQSFDIGQNSIRPRGTAEFILGNVFGRAAQLSFVTQFSLKEKRGVFSWEDRYFFGLPLQTTFLAWLERDARVSYGFDMRGVSLTVIKPVFKNWVTLTTLGWTRTTLYFLDVAENEVDRQHFPYSATSISESLILDRRDDTFNPERGSFFSLALNWAYPLFNAESDYLKGFVKYQRYFPLFGSLNLAATGRLGLGMGRMPIHERFFAGGSNSFRGEPFDDLGPRDPHSLQPVGGKALFLLNLELRFPLFSSAPNLTGAVFYDKGNVFSNRSDWDFTKLKDALGFGIRYRTPLGPVRIDLGWNLQPTSGRAQPIVFITIGDLF